MTKSEWRDKTAFVTGASAGIGRAIVEELSQMGLRVAFCARRKDRLDRLSAGLSGPNLPLVVDLRNEQQLCEAFQQVRQRFGGVDVLVNNAGLGHRMRLCDADTEAMREMLDVNILALCVATREALRDMRAQNDQGHVIHICSLAGHRVPQGGSVYAATKHAVVALTEALRQELRSLQSKIRVSAISPGVVETEFAEVFNGSAEAAKEAYSRFKVLEARDVAAAVRYVLEAPPHVQVHDILLRPTAQPS